LSDFEVTLNGQNKERQLSQTDLQFAGPVDSKEIY